MDELRDQSESMPSFAPSPELLPAANDNVALPAVLALRFTASGKVLPRLDRQAASFCCNTGPLFGLGQGAPAAVFRLQNQLAGAVFDFRGNPKAILRGRVLGVILLAAYHYAFGFSRTFGVTVIAVLLLALPFLLRSALRFAFTSLT